MKCSCGGALESRREPPKGLDYVNRILGPPPRHKKTRTRKKRMKEYTESQRALLLAVNCMAAMMKPHFVCGTCGRREGFYSAIGRNMITVEPMPPGALPIYNKDPGVAAIVTDEIEAGYRSKGGEI